MKVNDKHLMAVATNNSAIDKEGFLLKRGEVNKSYQKRWFVLKGNLLFYFERKGDREPIGVIVIEGCTVELAESTDAYAFELVFQGAGTRTYILATDTQEDMECWMKAIACASYDYMKLMVTELQRQLDELNTERAPIARPPRPGQPPRPQSHTHQQQDLLVSIDTDGTPRSNPFNSGASQASASVDLFGAVPLQEDLLDGSKTRTFDDMHRYFGNYIRQKMQEHSLQSS